MNIIANGKNMRNSFMGNFIEVVCNELTLNIEQVEIVNLDRVGFEERYIDFLSNGDLYMIKNSNSKEVYRDNILLGTQEEWELLVAKGGVSGENVKNIGKGRSFIDNPFLKMLGFN